jgi:hypothetical protein
MQAMLSFLPNSTDTVLVTAWFSIEQRTSVTKLWQINFDSAQAPDYSRQNNAQQARQMSVHYRD